MTYKFPITASDGGWRKKLTDIKQVEEDGRKKEGKGRKSNEKWRISFLTVSETLDNCVEMSQTFKELLFLARRNNRESSVQYSTISTLPPV